MSAFGAMFGTLHADPNLTVPVYYRPAGAARTPDQAPIAAMKWQPDEEIGFFDTKAKASPLRLAVQVAEVAAIGDGDLFDVGTSTYGVAGCEADPRRLRWRLTLRSLPDV